MEEGEANTTNLTCTNKDEETISPCTPLAAVPLEVNVAPVKEDYVLAVDIGTSCIRGHVYNRAAQLKGTASRLQQILQPEPGWCEIDPQKLVQDVCTVARESIRAAGLQPDQITCMGITTMTASFVTWDRETGVPFHNLITWQDLRAVDYVSQWNRSYRLLALNTFAKLLYQLFRNKQYLAASVLKFLSKHVTMRLLWVFDNIPEVRTRASQNQVMFGCTETWLLWKLTQERIHVTDFSCASATGLFDPFQLEWSTIVCGLVNIPTTIFPEVRDTSGDFGVTDPAICGFKIPVTAVIADLQGSMFGHCCFEVGDVKCTLGTGTFLNINIGSRPHASLADLYPIIGWKIGPELVYLAEGQSTDTGTVIEWARGLDLFDDVAETSDLAESVPDSGGVFFVPAFSGLQAPYNDDKAAAAMFGMTPNTTKAHFVRALLESLVFRFKSLYDAATAGTRIPLSHIRVDGGVATNNFLVQMMSDAVNQVIHRSLHSDISCLGTAFLAGLAKGLWANKDELKSLRQSDRLFAPRSNHSQISRLYRNWGNAVQRSQKWYPPP
ncbi:hypothetical protein BsWGS_09657 [Bradybaena similaris]